MRMRERRRHLRAATIIVLIATGTWMGLAILLLGLAEYQSQTRDLDRIVENLGG